MKRTLPHKEYIIPGCTGLQTKVIRFLWSNGPSPVSTIARGCDIERTSCYQIIHSLEKLGYVYSTSQKSGKLYTAHDADFIQLLIQRGLPKSSSTPFTRPHVAQYIGYEQVRSMLYDRYPIRQKDILEGDGVYRGFQDTAFVDMFKDWLERHRKHMGKDEKIQIMTNASPTEKKLSNKIKGRNIKFFKHIKFSSTLRVGGNYIITVVIKDSFVYAFEQKDPVLAANLAALFDFLRASK